MNQVLGARGATGYVLGRGAGSAAQWWMAAGVTPVAAYAPKGAASLAASYVNLANPGTYNAAPGVAPTWDAATGWTGNGTTQYLKTGITPPTGAPLWSVIVRFTLLLTDGVPLGFRDTVGDTGAFHFHPSTGGRRYYRNGNNTGLWFAPGVTIGSSTVLAMAGATAYLNGVAEAGTIPGTIDQSAELYLLAFNSNGIPGAWLNGTVQALAIYAATLSAAQVAAVTAAMNLL